MDKLHEPNRRSIGKSISLKELGKSVQVYKVSDEMRLITCPNPQCQKSFIRPHREDVTHIKCVCKTKIKLKERWYDDTL